LTIDTPDWVRDAVFYQIFPDRFARSPRVHRPGPLDPWDDPPTVNSIKGGDLLGVAERLGYLETLGVNALYLNPVFTSAAPHRYHPYDFYAVDPLLGGDEALRELLDAAHARGIRVVLDGVFNHAGRGFWPFHHVMELGASSPYRDWFHLNPEFLASGRQLRAYAAEYHSGPVESDWAAHHASGMESLQTLGYRAWWDLPALPKLNTDNPEVREHLLGAAEHWVRFGIDGWRLDVPSEIADDEFWREFRRRVRRANPEAYIVGEIWHEEPDTLRGDMFDALMNYPLATAIINYVSGGHLDMDVVAEHGELRRHLRREDAAAFAGRLERAMTVYPPEVTAVQLNLIGSHDTPRFITLCGGDRAALRLASLVQMTLPGAPSIYYGDEIAMPGHHDPDCRRSFPVDPEGADADMLRHYRAVIALRHANPVLRRGRFRMAGAAGTACAYLRIDQAGAILVALNAGDAASDLRLSLPGLERTVFEHLPLPGQEAVEGLTVEKEAAVLAIRPREGLVLRAEAAGR
jgi:cyclomaltodextrinase / maltogenic alpha-amylase / neopullulanase